VIATLLGVSPQAIAAELKAAIGKLKAGLRALDIQSEGM
jgi:hypothetical protein